MKPELNKRPTRHGKIARLPHHVREELNQRLRDGQGGKPLIRWLNDHEEAFATISAQNLTEWRQGGYAEWLARQEQCEMVWRFAEEAQGLEAASQGVRLSQCLSTVAAAQLAVQFQTLVAQPAEPRQRFEDLQHLIRSLALLRREDTKAQQAQFVTDKFRWEQLQKEHDESKRSARFQEILHGIAARNAAAEAELKAMDEEADEETNVDEFLPEKPNQPKKAPSGAPKQTPKNATRPEPQAPASTVPAATPMKGQAGAGVAEPASPSGVQAPAAAPKEVEAVATPQPGSGQSAIRSADRPKSNLIKLNQASEPAPTPEDPTYERISSTQPNQGKSDHPQDPSRTKPSPTK